MNVGMDARMNECTHEQMHEWTHKRTNSGMDECVGRTPQLQLALECRHVALICPLSSASSVEHI